MTAEHGVIHSEFNPSGTTAVHFYQIWIVPRIRGLLPGYSQQKVAWKQNAWTLLAAESPAAPLNIHQDVELFGARIDEGKTLAYSLKRGGAWLQIVRGEARIGNEAVKSGDGVAVKDEASVSVTAISPGCKLTDVDMCSSINVYNPCNRECRTLDPVGSLPAACLLLACSGRGGAGSCKGIFNRWFWPLSCLL
jgi:hypothetical protein